MSQPRTHLRNRLLFALLCGGALMASMSTPAASQRRPSRAPVPDDVPPRPTNETVCNYQEPIPNLIRENFLPRWTQPPEEQRRRQALQAETVRFRTEHYGYFEGFGQSSWNEHAPTHYAERTEFMGLSVRLNQQILPALACIEEQLRVECADEDYTPVRLSGIRTRNTYHNSQVSNHVYGIAIDVDPQLNTCCMCVAQWGDHPLCQREVESIYERMSMPSCWVHVFERFGFYWLGRDRLQDTMHFEFLGDPEHILKTTGMPPHMSEAAGEAGGESGGEAGGEADDGNDETAENTEAAEAVEETAAGEESTHTDTEETTADEPATMTQSAEAAESAESSAGNTSSPPASAGGCSVFAPGAS